jgi:hypothetical protein
MFRSQASRQSLTFRSQASRKRAGVVGSVALGVALLAGGAVACGGGSGGNTPNSVPSADGFAAYTTCLSNHGVKLPTAFPSGRPSGFPSGRPSGRPSRSPGEGSGGGGGGGFFGGFGNNPPAGVDAATWQAAQQACASVRPTAGASRGAGGNSAFVAYRNCLSEHGVTAGANMNTADPKVAAALQTCEPLRPTGGPRPTSTN